MFKDRFGGRGPGRPRPVGKDRTEPGRRAAAREPPGPLPGAAVLGTVIPARPGHRRSGGGACSSTLTRLRGGYRHGGHGGRRGERPARTPAPARAQNGAARRHKITRLE